MTEPSQPSPMPPRPPRILDYAPADPNRPAGGVPHAVQFALGILASLAACAGTASVLWFDGFPGGICFGGTIAGTLLVISVEIALYLLHWPGFARGVVVGVLLIVGLVILAIGICFASFR